MVKRLCLVVSLVVCFAGCGGGEKPKTLKNLTFYELTVLRRAEIEELREARESSTKNEERIKEEVHMIYVINSLRREAWEKEWHETNVGLPPIN